MGRPKLKEELKRAHVSISVKKTIEELASSTPNKSHFYETSVEACQALALVVNRLRSKKMTLEIAIEEIEDIADIWAAEFDESLPFDLSRSLDESK